MPQAEGEYAAVSRGRREPPPQSLRDSSPAGGAFSDPDSQILPLRGRCPAGAEGEYAAVSGGRRKPPPQSLRDSSPSERGEHLAAHPTPTLQPNPRTRIALRHGLPQLRAQQRLYALRSASAGSRDVDRSTRRGDRREDRRVTQRPRHHARPRAGRRGSCMLAIADFARQGAERETAFHHTLWIAVGIVLTALAICTAIIIALRPIRRIATPPT